MTWHYITRERFESEGKWIWKRNVKVAYKTNHREDDVGNIWQYHGGVNPKACQNCKVEFKSEVESFPINQTVPMYACHDCSWENASGDEAFDHSLINHNVYKTSRERLVGVDRKLTGIIPHIKIVKDTCSVLCEDCSNAAE